MGVKEEIKAYIASQPESKRNDMQALHKVIMELMPGSKLWFLDGKDSDNKIVSNPNIGYGVYAMKYADGKAKEFYQVGLSANTTGISVYIMGLKDRGYLPKAYGTKIGKAKVTGYCIKFNAVKDIDIEVLKVAIQDGVKASSTQ